MAEEPQPKRRRRDGGDGGHTTTTADGRDRREEQLQEDERLLRNGLTSGGAQDDDATRISEHRNHHQHEDECPRQAGVVVLNHWGQAATTRTLPAEDDDVRGVYHGASHIARQNGCIHHTGSSHQGFQRNHNFEQPHGQDGTSSSFLSDHDVLRPPPPYCFYHRQHPDTAPASPPPGAPPCTCSNAMLPASYQDYPSGYADDAAAATSRNATTRTSASLADILQILDEADEVLRIDFEEWDDEDE